ncbi:MAG: hypothetical protein ACI8RD_002954 [Bacillariaceae sp.]|jgi:hypothetical protein
MASPFLTGGQVMILRKGTLTIAQSAMGTKILDRASGHGFFLSNTGERMAIEDGLDCDCGQEFTSYVRQNVDPFPYNQMQGGGRTIENLWPERKLKMNFGGSSGGNNADGWREGKVFSWYEWLSGPFSNTTIWSLTVKLDRCEEFCVGDVVKIIPKDKTGTIISRYDSNSEKFVVRYREYSRESNENEDITVECHTKEIELVKEIEFSVNKANVKDGGILQVDSDIGMENTDVSFVWLDDPSPAPLLANEVCYHGSSEDNFNGDFQDAINNFLWNHSGDILERKSAAPDHNLPTIERFVEENGHLITEEFCRHVYANCIHQYLIANNASNISLQPQQTIHRLFMLATNLRYRYIQQEVCDRDVEKISKHGRDIHTERGQARTLAKEVSCSCAGVLRKKAKTMRKEGTCFGCHAVKDKAGLMECSKCRFARYCTKQCQGNDWYDFNYTFLFICKHSLLFFLKFYVACF